MSEPLMERALALARRARGTTSPNPPVGAVLVRDGEIVGEGFTQPPGGAHAEIVALAAAGYRADGATLYVTLEPCSHWGRTPPCVDALIAARISSAHVALLDPNPLVNGGGVARLREHGIPVEIGEAAADAADLIEAHSTLVRLRRAFLTLAVEVPDSCLREIGRDTDALLTDGPVPAGWAGPVYRLGSGRKPIHATLVQGVNDAPGAGMGADNIRTLLAVLGRRAASVLAAGSDTLARRLVAEGVVDKLVAGPGGEVPPGFVPRSDSDAAGDYRVYYPPASD